ncbi:MAG: (d)CMP kinase, partial [Bacteroidia bacterium]|nr:(d)CMP kinase [Bacteroidia bacterium]
GAMYRAVTLAIIRNKISLDELHSIEDLLPTLQIEFDYNEGSNFHHIILNDVDVEKEIRSMEVANLVSPVSKISAVRKFLVTRQQLLGFKKGVVMDGRDIGTVVFPDAELKIYMTASAEVRAQRRFRELKEKGDKEVTYEAVLENLNSRDKMDSTRTDSPLKPATDAFILDNTFMSKSEQKDFVMKLVNTALSKRITGV